MGDKVPNSSHTTMASENHRPRWITSRGGADNVPSTIYLDIAISERVSNIELCLSRDDIEELYNEAFAGACAVCHGDEDVEGLICCHCFNDAIPQHTDCCLAEEEKT